ncbi:hypothetical protein GCM10027036_17380 [Flavihumibacter cheonanensis]
MEKNNKTIPAIRLKIIIQLSAKPGGKMNLPDALKTLSTNTIGEKSKIRLP